MVISKDFIIRSAILADVPELVPLFAAYRTFYQLTSDAAQLKAYLSARLSAEGSQIFVVQVGEQLVGFTQLYPGWCSLALEPYYTLYDLYVTESYRRRGLAARLMAAATDWARQQGADRLELATGVDNRDAQTLYRAMGWRRDCAFLHFSLPLNS